MERWEEKVQQIQRRYQEIEMRLSHPEEMQDNGAYQKLLKEYAGLQPICEEYVKYSAYRGEWQAAQEMLCEAGADAAIKEMIQQEARENQRNMAASEEKIEQLLKPADRAANKSVIVEIRAGAGGEEAAIFAADLYRMYSMFIQRHGWKLTVMSSNETELGGTKEIIFSVDGERAWQYFQYESGVHRVQRVPETENQGRIHTSTATVAALLQADEVEVEIAPSDLRIDTFRSSGAGGQHINKTSSAIRITHLPTGMVVECQNERSQFQNKEMALQVLRSRLLAQKQQQQQDSINAERHEQVGGGRRSEKIRTYNYPQDRITDHRIGLTVHNLEKVLNGNLDELMEALQADAAAKELMHAGEMK